LITEVSGFNINFNQFLLSKEISVRLEKLLVTDNSRDDRYPTIFENNPDSTPSVTVSLIDPADPSFNHIETDIVLNIGRPKLNYKP
jgi:hypothetical protein